ncbi:unnamed protein product [Schistosoma turkestanicum]|nr:unnamed protein product [Schistosoma turkestanicum]
MQTPLYEKNENQFLKFTGLGWIIAHEFLHAIDITGILFDENGNLRTSRNSETGLIANIKQADCLRLHYKLHPDAYGKLDEKSMIIKNVDHNSSFFWNQHEQSNRIGTQDEILTDSGGLKIMYDTHRRVLTRRRIQNASEILSSDRLFFLKFAQTFCGHMRAGLYAHYQNNAHHLFREFRVFGALSNSEEFAKAYNCSTDSPMNPSNKCKLW